jgi:RNA polymerase sigma-70 factor, ECF subfamily
MEPCPASPRHPEPRAQARDPSISFERLYDEHANQVRRWVRAHGARPSDTDDLVQEVFVVAYRRLRDFDGTNVEGWLYRITSRKVRDFRRGAWSKYFFTARTLAIPEQTWTTGRTALDEVLVEEQSQRFERALNGLSLVQRAAFVLFELEGHSGQQVAELQAASLNTVWSRLHKARHALQFRLAPSYGFGPKRRQASLARPATSKAR